MEEVFPERDGWDAGPSVAVDDSFLQDRLQRLRVGTWAHDWVASPRQRFPGGVEGRVRTYGAGAAMSWSHRRRGRLQKHVLVQVSFPRGLYTAS